MSALDRRMRPLNMVLRHCRRDKPGVSRLVVDKTHPFFFDHPLDHVPGLLLLEGAVQAAQSEATESCFVSSIVADFKQYTFFDKEIFLHSIVEQGIDTVVSTIEVIQDNIARASIRVALTSSEHSTDANPLSPFLPTSQSHDLVPCAGRAINKKRAENVLITSPVMTDDKISAQLLPMAPECVFSDSAETVHPLYLLESFMQIQRYLNANQDGDKRIRDILTGVSFEQTSPIFDMQDGVSIDGAREFVRTGKNRLARSAWLRSGERLFAKCSIRTAQVETKPKSKSTTPQPA